MLLRQCKSNFVTKRLFTIEGIPYANLICGSYSTYTSIKISLSVIVVLIVIIIS